MRLSNSPPPLSKPIRISLHIPLIFTLIRRVLRHFLAKYMRYPRECQIYPGADTTARPDVAVDDPAGFRHPVDIGMLGLDLRGLASCARIGI
jgi:hypothetical protein